MKPSYECPCWPGIAGGRQPYDQRAENRDCRLLRRVSSISSRIFLEAPSIQRENMGTGKINKKVKQPKMDESAQAS